VILDGDPRKARAFEIEKYATYAGLSKDFIQNGVNAVNNDDWDTQKNIFKDITKALAKNPNWSVDVPSNAEFNVMITEEKAIQEAALASLNIEEINTKWNDKLSEQSKEFKPLAGLNTTWIEYSSLQSNVVETNLVNEELDKILNDSGFKKTFEIFTNGHMFQKQLELYDFIMNPPTEFNISAIKILDINKEDLQLTLESFGETTPPQITNERKFNSHPHKRSPIIQETVRHILSKHGDMINQLLLPNLYGWINLLKITYPTDTSDKKATIDNPIHTLEKFQSQQYLNNPFKEYSDIFKPELYLSWSDKEYCKLNLYNKNTI
jgi:hypothetical protein